MSTEQLPDGLQLAVTLLAQIGDDDSDRAIAAVHDLAEEHAQRLTLQQLCADQVWRIADLEVKCVTLKGLHDAATDERDELRAKYDELLVALHGIGAALGIPEGDRSPYSVTCGVLERVNRLAVIEAQEPVALVETSGDQGAGIGWSGAAQHVGAKLYAGPAPVPEQAVPAGWRLVPVEPTDEMLTAAARASMQHLIDCIHDPKRAKEVGSEEMCKRTHASRYRSMIAAAPEAAR